MQEYQGAALADVSKLCGTMLIVFQITDLNQDCLEVDLNQGGLHKNEI